MKVQRVDKKRRTRRWSPTLDRFLLSLPLRSVAFKRGSSPALELTQFMSQARITFDSAIQDAEVLLEHFDGANTHPPPKNTEVLKRAGLVMALNAWETYVEDLARELLGNRLAGSNDEQLTELVVGRLESELKRFHNPNGEKTRQLFVDYLSIDVTLGWKWGGYDPESAMAKLNELLAKRGDAVHRAKPIQADSLVPHLVKRDDLEKAIRFLKHLVAATERAVIDVTAPTRAMESDA